MTAESSQPALNPSPRPSVDLAAGSFLSLVYRVLGIIFLALLTAIVARALTVEDFGIFRTSVVVIGAVGSLGGSFASSVGYFVTNRKRTPAEVAANGTLLSLAIGLLGLAVSLAIWLFYDGEHRTLILLVGISLFPIVARSAIGGVFLGVNGLWRYSFAIQGHGYVAVALVLVWVVALDRRGPGDALGAWIAAQYITLALLALAAYSWWGWLATHRPNFSLMRDLMAFGSVTGLAGVISFLNYRVDQLLVAGLDGAEGAGIYAAAVTIAEGLWLFSTAISIAAYASIGSLDRKASAALTARGVRHTLLVVSALALPIAILAPILLRIVFGSSYTEADMSLRVLCLGTLAFAPQSILSTYFTVQLGRPLIALSLSAGSLVVSIVLSLLLVPQMGYIGAAWATAISYALAASGAVFFFLRTSEARFSDLWRFQRADFVSYWHLAARVLSGKILRRSTNSAGPGT